MKQLSFSRQVIALFSVLTFAFGFGAGGLIFGYLSSGKADVLIGSSSNQRLANAPLVDAPGITGNLAPDGGQAYGAAVMGNMTDQVAVGLANAATGTASSTPSTGFIDKLIPSAKADQCTDLANQAIDNALAYWLPGGTGTCAEITGKYSATYITYRLTTGTNGDRPNFLIKVTLSTSGLNVRWRDPDCSIKSATISVPPITKYYAVTLHISNMNNPQVDPISQQYFDYLLQHFGHTVSCSGVMSNSVKIGNINNCPRCNKSSSPPQRTR